MRTGRLHFWTWGRFWDFGFLADFGTRRGFRVTTAFVKSALFAKSALKTNVFIQSNNSANRVRFLPPSTPSISPLCRTVELTEIPFEARAMASEVEGVRENVPI